MRILANRIVISLVLILGAAAYWEFELRPVSGPLYMAAVSDYHEHRYHQSLAELREGLKFEPNDPSILALMGWDALKTHEAASAAAYFRRARRFAPVNSDPLLGEIYAEIALQKYQKAKRLLSELRRQFGETAEFESARSVLLANKKVTPAQQSNQTLPAGPGARLNRPPNKVVLTVAQQAPARR